MSHPCLRASASHTCRLGLTPLQGGCHQHLKTSGREGSSSCLWPHTQVVARGWAVLTSGCMTKTGCWLAGGTWSVRHLTAK